MRSLQSRRKREAKGASFYASDSPGHGRYVVTLHRRHTLSDEDDITYYGSFDDFEEAKERANQVLPYIGYDWPTPEGPRVTFFIQDSHAKPGAKDDMYCYIKNNVLRRDPMWESVSERGQRRKRKYEGRKNREQRITIPEDVRIPGTNVILEAGDKVKILENRYDVSDMSLENLDLFVGTSIKGMLPQLREQVSKVLNRNMPAYMPTYEVAITEEDIYKMTELVIEGTFRVYDSDSQSDDLYVMEGDFSARAYSDSPDTIDTINIVRLVDFN